MASKQEKTTSNKSSMQLKSRYTFYGNKKYFGTLAVLVLVFFLGFVLGAVLFSKVREVSFDGGKNQINEVSKSPVVLDKKNLIPENEEDKSIRVEPNETSWKSYNFKKCDAIFPIPPKIEPYWNSEDDRYWVYEETGSAEYLFNEGARIIHMNENDAGGNWIISGLVSVSCGINNSNLTLDSLGEGYKKYAEEYGSTMINEKSESHWGVPTLVQSYDGGQQPYEAYLFVSKDMLYMVDVISMTKYEKVADATTELLSKIVIGSNKF